MIVVMVSRIFLVPLYLIYIPLNIYGAWLATGNILIWLTAVDPGLSSILQQRVAVAYGRKDTEEICGYAGGGLLLSGVISGSLAILGIIVSRVMFTWLRLPPSVDSEIILRAFFIALAGSALMTFSYSVTAVNLGFQGTTAVGAINLALNLLGLTGSVILLYKGFGLDALAIPAVINGGGLIIANFAYMRWRFHKERIPWHFSLNGLRMLSRFLSVTFAARSATVIAKNMDLFVIGRYLGPEAVACFNLTRRAPEMSQMFVERPATAFMPAVSHLVGCHEEDKARAILIRLMRITSWLLGLIVGGFIAFNDDFVRLWVGSHLFAGQLVNLLFCLNLLLSVSMISLSNLCFALGDIKKNSIATFSQAAICVPLSILGVLYLGFVGIALAPVVSMLAVSAWYFPLSFSRLLRLGPSDHRQIVRELLAILAVAAPLTIGGTCFHLSSWGMFLIVVGMYCGLYMVGLYVLSPHLREESQNVLALLKQKRASAETKSALFGG